VHQFSDMALANCGIQPAWECVQAETLTESSGGQAEPVRQQYDSHTPRVVVPQFWRLDCLSRGIRSPFETRLALYGWPLGKNFTMRMQNLARGLLLDEYVHSHS
jgi:hypothetical protein